MTRHDMPRSWDPVRNFVSSACQSLLKSPGLRWTKMNFWGEFVCFPRKCLTPQMSSCGLGQLYTNIEYKVAIAAIFSVKKGLNFSF